MEKVYNPKDFEERIYDGWMSSKSFAADTHSKKTPFTIVIPPPNITGQLHMGHALNDTTQDAIIRYKRMKGFEACWIPGTDHASIATEVKIVEKLKAEGIDKLALGREGFLERAWKWKEQFGGRIVDQLKKLGCSCDWDRLAFTMDAERGEAVVEVFVRLYEEGFIYRGDRIINWCPHCKTALSDAEVDHIESPAHMWHIKYPVKGQDTFLTIATTRPETLLGDTAVAVNPSDIRYKKLVGCELTLPLTGRTIPLIADEYVDKAFGTGAVKITPAHDPNDFEVGKRHDLPIIRIMNDDGTINDLGGGYKGLDRLAARDKIVADLQAQGLLVKIEKHTSNKGHCYRCKQAVEPLVSKQWFVKMDELAMPAVQAVKSGEIKITPKPVDKIYLHWLGTIRDWCISRQLWWGHRIPAYYCDDCGKTVVSRTEPKACPHCGSVKLVQDEDVLDTWFSSALWTFSTLGWPKDTEDFAKFFPTDVLVTAQDIIFFWVARMVVMSYHFFNKAPFSNVVINGIVRDKDGKKMSKSSGNGIDPLELIDKYGTDALRFSLLFGAGMGADFRFSEDKVRDDRAFINKLWNAGRFVLLNSEGVTPLPLESLKLNDADKWILHSYNETVKNVTRMMDKYEVGQATKSLYDFVWSDFCDWYIEFSKAALTSADVQEKIRSVSMLQYLLKGILKALHPVIPFVTEEIYQSFFHVSILREPYPEANKKHKYTASCELVRNLIEVIKDVRELRVKLNVPTSKKPVMYLETLDKSQDLTPFFAQIARMSNAAEVRSTQAGAALSDNAATVLTSAARIVIPLDQLVDKDKERDRLTAELKNAQNELTRAESKLANPGFLAKAPPELLAQEKEKTAKFADLIQKINAQLKSL